MTSKINEIIDENEYAPVLFQVIECIKEFYAGLDLLSKNDDFQEQEDGGDDVTDGGRGDASFPLKNVLNPDNLKIISNPNKLIDRKSIFQGHVVKIWKKEHIQQAKNLIYASNHKIPIATHNIVAYRMNLEITNPKTGVTNTILERDCDDDGEKAAGGRLLHLLDMLKVENVYVMVTRWYGGIHLGPDRFKDINNCAREALEYAEIL